MTEWKMYLAIAGLFFESCVNPSHINEVERIPQFNLNYIDRIPNDPHHLLVSAAVNEIRVIDRICRIIEGRPSNTPGRFIIGTQKENCYDLLDTVHKKDRVSTTSPTTQPTVTNTSNPIFRP